VLDTFNGQLGPVRDIVVLNAAAGLTVAGISSSLEEGVLLAQASIDNGAALRVVEALKISSNAVAR
jgi:anthranilate phosphoribosyltransferase